MKRIRCQLSPRCQQSIRSFCKELIIVVITTVTVHVDIHRSTSSCQFHLLLNIFQTVSSVSWLPESASKYEWRYEQAYTFSKQRNRLSICPQTLPHFLVICRNSHRPQSCSPLQLLESYRILLTLPLIILSSELIGVVDRCSSSAGIWASDVEPRPQ